MSVFYFLTFSTFSTFLKSINSKVHNGSYIVCFSVAYRGRARKTIKCYETYAEEKDLSLLIAL